MNVSFQGLAYSILIRVNGYFGERMVDMAGCSGTIVHRMDKPFGDYKRCRAHDRALVEGYASCNRGIVFRLAACKVLGVAEQTSYRWRKAYDGPIIDQPRLCAQLCLKH
jgi:hypothetical protein